MYSVLYGVQYTAVVWRKTDFCHDGNGGPLMVFLRSFFASRNFFSFIGGHKTTEFTVYMCIYVCFTIGAVRDYNDIIASTTAHT